jgi:thymidylate kinase
VRNRGRLYVLEGPDGVGKSTLAAGLADHLRARGGAVHLVASPGRARGTLGQLVWQLHHSPAEFGVASVNPVSLQLLHVAAHIDTLDGVIRPAIQAGEDIVLDRFWWSTLVYGTRAGVPEPSLNAMLAIERKHWEGISPDRIFVIARERPFRKDIPQQEFEFLTQAYTALADEAPKATVIENRGPLEETLHLIMQAVANEAATS